VVPQRGSTIASWQLQGQEIFYMDADGTFSCGFRQCELEPSYS
jgi:hypothetical protein